MALVVVVALLIGALVGFLATSRTGTNGPSTTTTTSLVSTTSPTTLPVRAIRGVGVYEQSVTEPGVNICPPFSASCIERSFTLMVYYPASSSSSSPLSLAPPANEGSPYPLVVFGEGFDQMPQSYLPMITQWVRAGYVVASPVFPLTSSLGLVSHGVATSNLEVSDQYEMDMVNQPRDMSASISAVTSLNESSSSPILGLVNLAKIAISGQSDGGDTALANAYNSCCSDSRITAAMIFSGAEFASFNGSYFSGRSLPLLITQGSADSINPAALSQTIYAGAPSPKYLLILLGADHLSPYTEVDPYESAVAAVSIDFLNLYLKDDSQMAIAILSDGNRPSVSQLQSDP